MKRLLIYFFGFVLFLSSATTFPVRAQTQDFATRDKACVGSAAYGAQDVPTIQGVECLVANVLASAITLIGIVAFVFFLIGGFQYLTAGAEPKGVAQAKNSISYAIIGIVVALASFLILNLISNLTGIKTILQFNTQVQPTSSTAPAPANPNPPF